LARGRRIADGLRSRRARTWNFVVPCNKVSYNRRYAKIAWIAGAQRYAVERQGQPPKYTKHPATWLNGGCWEDDPPGAAVIDEQGNVVAFERLEEDKSNIILDLVHNDAVEVVEQINGTFSASAIAEQSRFMSTRRTLRKRTPS